MTTQRWTIGMDALFQAFLVMAGFAFLQAGLMLVHAWEQRRYYARRLAKKLQADKGLRVALIAPCKGMDTDLPSNLLALFEQSHPNYEICFVVESDCDPAIPVIRALQISHPRLASRLVVAGIAHNCGQKVHNLICSTRAILTSPAQNDYAANPTMTKGGRIDSAGPPDVLAFVDSDACPHVDWLARLVERVSSGPYSVATGYRWYVPQTGNFANRLLSAINNTVIGLSGPYGFNLVWGGAWAIRTETFKRLGLPDAWEGSLSDDLVVSRLVRRAGFRVSFEPHCLVKSPAIFAWNCLWEFLRRQFLVVRNYAPGWWQFAFWAGLATNICLWGMLGLSGYWAWMGGPWSMALTGGLAYYLAGVVRASLTARAVRPFISTTDDAYGSVARLNTWGWPLVSLATWMGIASAAFGRTIIWRGITYRMDSTNRTTILGKKETAHLERNTHARTKTRAA